jgi:ABC-2 type transport system ATP-binding protein
MITATALTKRYDGSAYALDHVSLRVKPAEIFALLGPHGAGKSTLVNIFFGLVPPTSGSALIGDVDVVASPEKALRLAALVPEKVEFSRRFTPLQHLRFYADPEGPPSLSDKFLASALRAVGFPERSFGEKMGDPAITFSRKLTLAVAIARNVPAVFLDEPFFGLDPGGTSEIFGILRDLRRQGMAILLTTEDPLLAKEIGDVVGILKEGVLIHELRCADPGIRDLEELYARHVAVK